MSNCAISLIKEHNFTDFGLWRFVTALSPYTQKYVNYGYNAGQDVNEMGKRAIMLLNMFTTGSLLSTLLAADIGPGPEGAPERRRGGLNRVSNW